MRIAFLSCAEAELHDAIHYYNEQSPGLGYEFAAEVKKTLERIVFHPEAWAPLSKRTRRCHVSGFPYGVIYQARGESVLVVAVMHMSRRPDCFEDRI